MKKFKEKRIVKILDMVSVIIGLCWIVLSPIGIFYHPFLLGFLLLPIAVIPILISFTLSDRDTYTRLFIGYMENKVQNAITLEDLKSIEREFLDLAVEGTMYCLSFPINLKNIHRDIHSKIELLEKQTKKNKYEN